MRANEFISENKKEGKVKKRAAAVQQGIRKSRDVGGYDRVNHMNRLWMATASYSWVEKYNTQHPYTQEEYNMFRQAENTVPTDSKEVTPWAKSCEPEDTYKVSPSSPWTNKKKKK
jgi:hypothetical protein